MGMNFGVCQGCAPLLHVNLNFSCLPKCKPPWQPYFAPIPHNHFIANRTTQYLTVPAWYRLLVLSLLTITGRKGPINPILYQTLSVLFLCQIVTWPPAIVHYPKRGSLYSFCCHGEDASSKHPFLFMFLPELHYPNDCKKQAPHTQGSARPFHNVLTFKTDTWKERISIIRN